MTMIEFAAGMEEYLPPVSGSDLPPRLTEGQMGEGAIAAHYERSLRRIALEKDADGKMTLGAEMAYRALLGVVV